MQDLVKETVDIKIEQIFPLEKIREAHRCLQQIGIGKIIVKM